MKVSDEIIKILDFIGEKFGVAIDWTDSTIISYIEQLFQKFVRYEIATSIIWISIAVICFMFSLKIIKNIYPKSKEILMICHRDYTVDETLIIISFILLILLSLGVICIGIYQIFDIVECITFPEKAIYEYIMSVIETTS